MDEQSLLAETLWRMYNENVTYRRHHEVQRTTAANFVLALAGAALTVIFADHQITRSDAPAAAFMALVGVFGALFTWRHHDRSLLHRNRARRFLSALDEMLPNLVEALPRTMVSIEQANLRLVKIHPKGFRKRSMEHAVGTIGLLLDTADNEHRAAQRPRFILLHLNHIWTAVHLVVFIIGCVLTIYALFFAATPSDAGTVTFQSF